MSEVLKIAVCEDETKQRNRLLALLDNSSIKTYTVFLKMAKNYLRSLNGKSMTLSLWIFIWTAN